MPDYTMTAVGLMSGTSMDGIDAAWIETDGIRVHAFGEALTKPYPRLLREALRRAVHGEATEREILEIERDLTLAHADAVDDLDIMGQADVIGFHGHTLLHRPEQGLTRQIGDGRLLARETDTVVVNDFRSADVAAGGQGAPLVPIYHAALARDLTKPLAVLNIGGVANVTWIGADGTLLAFDTGPGNAPIDDWTYRHTGAGYDRDGALASTGRVDSFALSALLAEAYFDRAPPKSLDRNAFPLDPVEALSPEDGAATLTAFTAQAVARAVEHFPGPVGSWLVCGGGRHNATLMSALREVLGTPVESVDAYGWDGDGLEAQAFAFLAVRTLRGLPITFPETTGVKQPMTGGVVHRPED